MKRRDFVTTVSLGLAAGVPAISTFSPTDARSAGGAANGASLPPLAGLDFASALEAAEAIRNKNISSVELTQRTFARIDKYNQNLNAFAYQTREEALARAKQADEAQAKGKTLGRLHGVPIHVKESFAVAGNPCTWGIPALKDVKAPENSEAVKRLLGAGAVLIGGTNVPINLSDWQSYNAIYGTTNNPWDVTRTPGGSSGGTAAALAAGLGYLSIGSDIGGSIRIPAHFCGLYGHKPTLDLVNLDGHAPGGQLDLPGFSTLLAVGGPIARRAEDLLVTMRILGGPADYTAKAWKWELPAPRHESLRDFRVGYVLDDPYCPVTPDTKTALEKAVRAIEKAGAKMRPGWPNGFQIDALYKNYMFHLYAFLYAETPPSEREAFQKQLAEEGHPIPGLAPFAEWQQQNLSRLRYRAQWQSYFNEVDVFLSPVAFTSAMPHDHSEPQSKRTITTPQSKRPYFDLVRWIAPGTLTGCPATAAPVGQGAGGLPIGMQIMGPFWEDATPITFAKLLAREIGGFSAPAGYAS